MLPDSLADGLRHLGLSEPDWLSFRPTGEKAWLQTKFNNVPRYLFRVYTPKSDGFTDHVWAKSKAFKHGDKDSEVDILTRSNDNDAADMLNRHLRWWPNDSDNLVSWTCSCLVALQYIVYRHADTRDGSPLENIFLCIVDTTSFPKGVFLRDMDLIYAYSSFDIQLKELEGLRSKKHRNFSGSFYFGEYLSQGALRIEDKCQIVSAKDLWDQGLPIIHPQLCQLDGTPTWANKVIELREPFYGEGKSLESITESELQAVVSITMLFMPKWRIPMAINLIALRTRSDKDKDAIVRKLRGPIYQCCKWQDSSPLCTNIANYDTLPEVQLYGRITHIFYHTSRLLTSLDYIKEAELSLRHGILAIHQSPESNSTYTSRKLPCLIPSHRSLLNRLDMVVYLSESLRE